MNVHIGYLRFMERLRYILSQSSTLFSMQSKYNALGLSPPINDRLLFFEFVTMPVYSRGIH